MIKKRFNTAEFLETVLADELTPSAFSTRLSALTEYQQMQVLLRVLSLWRMEEREQHDARKRTTADENGVADYDDSEMDDVGSISENMAGLLRRLDNSTISP